MNYAAAEEKLHQIAEELKNEKYLNAPDLGVLNGISGIALFLFHYYKYSKDEYYSELGTKYVTEVLDRINNGYSFPTYCSGIAGAAWTIEYLNEFQFIEFSSDENFSAIDEFLLENMNSCMENEQFDFLHCAIGYGCYFLKRYELTKSESLQRKYLTNVNQLIDKLYDSSVRTQNGIYWKNILPGFPDYSIDIGLAHGMSGIIGFLTKTLSCKIENPKAFEMLDLATNFILSTKSDHLNSAYPKTVYINPTDQHLSTESRMAWCYGDLGIANTFMNASKFIKEKGLLQESERIMLKCNLRKSVEDTGIVDSALCHGALGAALIYKNFHKVTSNEVFGEAAGYWLNEGLMMADFPDGLAGFKKYSGEEYTNEAGLLDGIAGIGLGILSLISDEELSWEQAMMI